MLGRVRTRRKREEGYPGRYNPRGREKSTQKTAWITL
jgi:hypothetical protein